MLVVAEIKVRVKLKCLVPKLDRLEGLAVSPWSVGFSRFPGKLVVAEKCV